ncbi:MAG: N-acetylmuramoyl-L-alanine amidase [Eubacteriales bacterium]|nr:N-acetylmuramoyl-L-alanine amidase [Eubacteriales bacterium]
MKKKPPEKKQSSPKNIYKDARLSMLIFCSIVILILLFYCFASLFTSIGYETFRKARDVDEKITAVINNNYEPLTIIIDPGHGGEDPGAVANGFKEKELNLAIASKLQELLSISGYNVVMTRSTDILLYKEGEEKRKKYYDLHNRLKIIESYENCIYVGIHMNKFPVEKYNGLQTFYSQVNSLSKDLALCVQESSKLLLPDNNRKIKPDNNKIFLLEHASAPAILVECGFLSNQREAQMLANKAYQEKLAFTIFCGITEFLSFEERT